MLFRLVLVLLLCRRIRLSTATAHAEDLDVEIPSFVLHNGVEVPLVGLGCASGVRTAHVLSALQVGYRFLDTAQSYRWGYHEDEVGIALEEFQQQNSDVAVFVQTKIHPEDLGYEATKRAVQVSLQRLKISHIDSVLIHKPRCWSGACEKEPEGTWQDSWKALEEYVDAGVVKAIGICDVDDRLLDELLQQRIRPHIIQNWMDPFHQETKIRERCQAHGILFQAYSTLGTQWVHFRGHDTNPVMNHPTLMALAQKYNVGVAQIVIQWATRRGVSVLPASTNADRQRNNLRASFTFALTDDEIHAIDALDGKAPTTSAPNPNQVAVQFDNRGKSPVHSYWVSGEVEEVYVGSIDSGEVLSLTSFHGHRFVFRDEDGNLLAHHTIEKSQGQKQHHVVVHPEL